MSDDVTADGTEVNEGDSAVGNLDNKLSTDGSLQCCSAESVLKYCLCVWFTISTVAQRRAPWGVLTVTRKITGCPLPSLEEPLRSHYYRNAQSILKEPSQPNTAASACAVALRLTFRKHKNCDKIHQEIVFPQKLAAALNYKTRKSACPRLCLFLFSLYTPIIYLLMYFTSKCIHFYMGFVNKTLRSCPIWLCTDIMSF